MRVVDSVVSLRNEAGRIGLFERGEDSWDCLISFWQMIENNGTRRGRWEDAYRVRQQWLNTELFRDAYAAFWGASMSLKSLDCLPVEHDLRWCCFTILLCRPQWRRFRVDEMFA